MKNRSCGLCAARRGLGNPRAGGQGSRHKHSPGAPRAPTPPPAPPQRRPSAPSATRGTRRKPQATSSKLCEHTPVPAPAPKAITAATSSPKLQNPNFADSKPGSRLRGNRAEANQGIQARRPSGFAPSTGFIETLRQGAVGLEIKTVSASQDSLGHLRVCFGTYFEKAINGIT